MKQKLTDSIFNKLIENKEQQHDYDFFAFDFEYRNYSFSIQGYKSDDLELIISNDYYTKNDCELSFTSNQKATLQALLVEAQEEENNEPVYDYDDADDASEFNRNYFD
ncbi:hypothetical protein Phi10:1_gp008 [Cellulophaga phage phi10:1]|uniref:Uncharacterized protein n=1 Tax=Cellulophaga phage phi10:1 TaxID=1327981 RepID=R9ZYE9_9CAUD|nr:hypothetical protein Phi10:1_gp008 [Cellulophaga phage phi10:1]AGO48349.1 hypothetical protein Phi10:1_gp008 [Cellulophaga phage phi10:1]